MSKYCNFLKHAVEESHNIMVEAVNEASSAIDELSNALINSVFDKHRDLKYVSEYKQVLANLGISEGKMSLMKTPKLKDYWLNKDPSYFSFEVCDEEFEDVCLVRGVGSCECCGELTSYHGSKMGYVCSPACYKSLS